MYECRDLPNFYHLMHYCSLWIREFPIRGLYHAHLVSQEVKELVAEAHAGHRPCLRYLVIRSWWNSEPQLRFIRLTAASETIQSTSLVREGSRIRTCDNHVHGRIVRSNHLSYSPIKPCEPHGWQVKQIITLIWLNLLRQGGCANKIY